MEKILVSACLLGQRVRYDGAGFAPDNLLSRWSAQGRLISLCPEMAGGLPVPRPPAEIIGGQGGKVLNAKARVVTATGDDVTQPFLDGARIALERCQQERVSIAILKSRSPSCGNKESYDGSFSGTRIEGQGVTAALLHQSGIRVFNEHELDAAAAYLQDLETSSG
ncbi:DUF523 domain-containing protein [Aestuariirhabdus sp. Z084]|uniref:DUF523 domain-containing protein n=1 Tax=Aestuariirhabdus haliotis TaxID=2918751 RepID=UPI00201B3AEA|nr:DUF523 domain-containing protein [Aestuariirhabdus haliotis]MCL6416695.1 DUF523 domain-containing protein [Aestuariirhabdus haliotis]MCL6420716.1 DUF523 domain-containing protein [Aestuariirhabdus haliotis]